MSIVRAVLGEAPVISIATREGYIAVTPTGTAGPAGPATEWRISSGWIQQRPVDLSYDWTNIITVASLIGPMPAHSWSGTQLRFETEPGTWGSYVDLKGDAVEIDVSGGFIRWRPTGGSWTNIVELTDLVGPDGPAIQLQKSATHIQWRVVGDPTWINLVALADITGPQGNVGPIGINLPLGPWNSGTAYVARDVVNKDGSSWICLVGHTNQSPPTLPTTANTYWSLLAKIGDTPTSLDISGVAGLTSELLGSAHSAITVAATDIVWECVYDTTLDDDKGAWRHRCAHTSWWSETLNTATRGAKRVFPQKAKIVLRSGTTATLAVYDLTDLDSSGAAKLWRSQARSTNGLLDGTPTAVSAINGRVYVTTSAGLYILDLVADRAYRHDASGRTTWSGALAASGAYGANAASGAIVSTTVSHVHARVLPGAPIDTYGLPVPKIAVATAGGVSVINEDGAVYDITQSSTNGRVALLDSGEVAFALGSANSDYSIGPVIYTDIAWSSWATHRLNSTATAGSSATLFSVVNAISGERAIGMSLGIVMLARDRSDPSRSMVSYIATNYASGWQCGAIRGAYLCDTTTGNITGGTVPDRSYKAGTLTVNGTLSRAAVNTGCDLAAFSGFSASNYLEQPYSPDFDFGSGDWSFTGWFKGTAAGRMFRRADTGLTGARIKVDINPSNVIELLATDAVGATITLASTTTVNDGQWHQFVACRRSGLTELWLDGALAASATGLAGSMSNATAILRLGVDVNGNSAFGGSLALFRVSATAPSAAQIARMYRDEAPLFSAGAKACLGGSSNSVTCMDFDMWSQRLLVGTGDGASEFSGLVRVGYFDTASTTLTNDAMKAVAAQGGYRSMAGGQQSIVVRDKVSQHDVVNAYPEQPPAWLTDELAAIRALALLGLSS